MTTLGKKRVIIINGPIGSGKKITAELVSLFYSNSKTVKISKESLRDYYTLIESQDAEGYYNFLAREIEKIIGALQDYLTPENTNDALIIITDVLAIIMLITEYRAPLISHEHMLELEKLKKTYEQILTKEIALTQIFTDASIGQVIFKIEDYKDELPKDYFKDDWLDDEITSYRELHTHWLECTGFTDEDGKFFS